MSVDNPEQTQSFHQPCPYGSENCPKCTSSNVTPKSVGSQLESDFRDYHDGRWDYNGPKPIEKAFAALDAYYKAQASKDISAAEARGRFKALDDFKEWADKTEGTYNELVQDQIDKINGYKVEEENLNG